MSEELEKKESLSAEQHESNREGYSNAGQSGGYQKEFRPGRSPRPRIHTPRPYNSERVNSEEGFRPEGFGAGLQSSSSQSSKEDYGQPRSGYRPRFQQREGGYQPRQGGYQQRGGYQQGGYQPRPRYNTNYRPRYNQEGGEEGGYQQGGYQPRQGGYQQRGGYQQGGYQQRGGFKPRGGYQQGGYRQRSADYDPNAKYSMKKRIEYKEEHIDMSEPIRLNKFLANAGVCSRREADDFIQSGAVTVNGTVVTELGTKVLRTDEVKFHDAPVVIEKKVYVLLNKPKDYVTTSDDPQQRKTVMDLVKDACPERIYPVGRLDRNTTGVLLFTNDGDLASKLTHPKFLKKKVYVLLNKPKDYVTTSDDPQQRKTVMDLVKNACSERIYPVGRLDRNTTGVLLLTNDGDLASKLTHPKYLKKKIYHVYLDKNVTAHDLQQIAEGIQLEDGEIKADDVQYASPTDKKQVGIEIHSGKNRIVRRIFESLGYHVTKLDRVQFAGLTKKNLKRGDWRYLTEEEVDRLRMGAYE